MCACVHVCLNPQVRCGVPGPWSPECAAPAGPAVLRGWAGPEQPAHLNPAHRPAGAVGAGHGGTAARLDCYHPGQAVPGVSAPLAKMTVLCQMRVRAGHLCGWHGWRQTHVNSLCSLRVSSPCLCYRFAAGLLPYAYLPLASARVTPGSWGDLTTLEGFFKHLLRQEYVCGPRGLQPPSPRLSFVCAGRLFSACACAL